MKDFRDLEQLSSHLDGQLSPSDSARMESRLASDPGLASAFNDLRAARNILRKLPARKAPRNFTLTRQMVGLKPPLPKSYSFFRFSTAFASILLLLTFAANALSFKSMTFGAAAPVAQEAIGVGGGGGGPLEESFAAATEAPASTEPPAEMIPAPTEMPPSADTARIEATPGEESIPKEPEVQSEPQDQLPAGSEALVPVVWQVVLFVLILAGVTGMLVMRQSAKRKWK
jgi:anti-sigma factor RsiW